MSSNVIDELITRYTLDDKDYDAGSKRILNETQQMERQLGQAVGRVRGLFSSIFRPLTSPLTGLLGGAGLFALGKEAVDLSMQYDLMTRSLEAITHSATRAKEVMKFVDALAIPSKFVTQELGQAATRLEAFGLKTETYLPIVEKLGTVFGGSAQDLMQFTDALGRLKGGMSGRAFEEFARAGLNRQDFMKVGLRFEKSGELLSPINEALDAVVKLVNQRFGTLSQTVGSSYSARWATFAEQSQRALRQVGGTILNEFLPAAEQMGGVLENLVSSGQVSRIARNWLDALGFSAGGLKSAMQTVADVLEVLPDRAKTFFDEIKGGLSFVYNYGTRIGVLWASIWAGTKAYEAIQLLIAGMSALKSAIVGAAAAQAALDVASGAKGAALAAAALAAGVATYYALSNSLSDAEREMAALHGETTGLASALDRAGEAAVRAGDKINGMAHKKAQDRVRTLADREADLVSKITDLAVMPGEKEEMNRELKDVRRQLKEALADLRKTPKDKPTAAESAKPDDTLGSGQGLDYLGQIAANTKAQVENFSRFAFGGGDLAAAGVSPVELATIRHQERVESGRTGGAASARGAFAAPNYVADNLLQALDRYMRTVVAGSV